MSDDLPTSRSPKLRPEVVRDAANARDQDTLLPGTLKTALLRELSPTRSQRERVQSALAVTLGGASATSPAIEQADAEMAARAQHLDVASVATGTSLATKVIVSSLLLTSAAALTTVALRRSEPPAATRAPIGAPSTAPQELPAARAAKVATAPAQAESWVQPAAAPAAKLDTDSRSSTAPAAAAEPMDIVVHARPRRGRAPVSPPVATDSTGQSPSEHSAAVRGASDLTTDLNTPTGKPAPTLSAEIALVRGASDALDRRDAKSALALLARYRQTYPAGALAIEVQALRAIALCLDNHPRAAEARDAFLREHGKSALAGRVRSGCK